MDNPILTADPRTIHGKQVSELRRNGQVPAVLYGHGKDTQSLTLDCKSFEKLYASVGTATLLTLEVTGSPAQKVLIHDTQYNPRRRELLHVDLYVVNLKEKIRLAVPVTFIGVAPAVDTLGGILITVKDEVEIECLPNALVAELVADLSALTTFDSTFKVSDLTLPKGITLLDEMDEIIVSISAPRSEEDLDLDSTVVDSATTVASETKSGTDTPEVDPNKKPESNKK